MQEITRTQYRIVAMTNVRHHTYPLRFIASLLWLGFVMAISFMEAPLKFQAPAVSLAIGLGIGKIIFAALNKVEWVMLLIIVLSFMMSGVTRKNWLWLGLVFIILAVQSVYLLPVLDARASMIINGGSPPQNNNHFFYIALEVLKSMLLLVMTFQFIYGKNYIGRKSQQFETTEEFVIKSK
ncbi:hypothetical protein QQ020_32380 [Fulvivirgaceae bacterium BMA12]|uniref:Transmembrane protein n=1 Tax=Agaribacillus aureus TaxID=3051825 RepID=A0ABT8LKI7_9BACT|nr:hypothetical protein [Fulvivirgaceae bacterium BMA12]